MPLATLPGGRALPGPAKEQGPLDPHCVLRIVKGPMNALSRHSPGLSRFSRRGGFKREACFSSFACFPRVPIFRWRNRPLFRSSLRRQTSRSGSLIPHRRRRTRKLWRVQRTFLDKSAGQRIWTLALQRPKGEAQDGPNQSFSGRRRHSSSYCLSSAMMRSRSCARRARSARAVADSFMACAVSRETSETS